MQSYANIAPESRPLLAMARARAALTSVADGPLTNGHIADSRPPRQVRALLGREQIEELVARYAAGTPTTQLMDEFGLSKTAVLGVLRRAGVDLRRQPLTPEQVDAARRLYENGASLAAVSQRLGLARESVRRALIEGGVVMRPRGGVGRRHLLESSTMQ